jgi:hypothetical protein
MLDSGSDSSLNPFSILNDSTDTNVDTNCIKFDNEKNASITVDMKSSKKVRTVGVIFADSYTTVWPKIEVRVGNNPDIKLNTLCSIEIKDSGYFSVLPTHIVPTDKCVGRYVGIIALDDGSGNDPNELKICKFSVYSDVMARFIYSPSINPALKSGSVLYNLGSPGRVDYYEGRLNLSITREKET